jgi:hypothetical protein
MDLPGGWGHPLVRMKRGQTSEHWFPNGREKRSACGKYTQSREWTLRAEPLRNNWRHPCGACWDKYQKVQEGK